MVTVEDKTGAKVTSNVKLTVTGALPVAPLVFDINGCTADTNTACPLPNATKNSAYLYSFSASGGDPAVGITWDFQNLPAWLKPASGGAQVTGNTGFVSGTPTACGKVNFLVTAKRGTQVVTRQVSVEIVGNPASVPPACP